eukprot:TRINITY_DN980_c0_g1_i2.p1 TRINITY_DN980_c0_g1~~TRINITY_DN980_c0_g1_i2.p1  ORF type:complete len:288 (-),score=73.64 TRINITY_DN980_c0_g1_i2:35-898(-)
MAFVFGMLPYILSGKISERKRDIFLSMGNSFAGGLFFSIGFFHLLPESNEIFEEVTGSHFPYAFAIAPLGFLLIFFIEKVLFNHDHEKHINSEEIGLVKQSEGEGEKSESESQSGSNQHSVNKKSGAKSEVFGAFILFLAVSIHSIIEGVTLGIQSNVNQMIPILTAILSHKWTDTMALGINLARVETPFKKYLIEIILVSFMTPFGVLLGSAIDLSVSDDVSEFISAIVLAVATGTFIYVAVVDIILPEFKNPKYKWFKFCFLIFGMLLIGIITQLLHGEHDHSKK